MLHIAVNAIQVQNKQLLPALQLQLNKPCMHMLIGRNGTGKSTLLRSICNLQEGNTGVSVQLNQQFIPQAQLHQYLSFVPSTPPTACLLTTEQVVQTSVLNGTALFGAPKVDTQLFLGLLHMQHMAKQTFDRCSDGEKQKIMIARALARQTPVLVLDEPLAFLDYTARIELLQLLQNLAEQQQKFIILSTHDLQITATYAASISLLANEQHYLFAASELQQAIGLF